MSQEDFFLATRFRCKIHEYQDIKLRQIDANKTKATWQNFYIVNLKGSPCAVVQIHI